MVHAYNSEALANNLLTTARSTYIQCSENMKPLRLYHSGHKNLVTIFSPNIKERWCKFIKRTVTKRRF